MPITFHKKAAASYKDKTSSEKPTKPSEHVNQIGPISLLVDKIVITANVPSGGYSSTLSAFSELKKGAGLLKPTNPSAIYNTVQAIALEGHSAHFSFEPKKPYIPDLRLEFNPAKMGAKGMTAMHEVLSHLLPFGGWDFLIDEGHVSRLDVAADIEDARMYHFHVVPHQVLVTKTYENQGKLKNIYIGKVKGNQLAIYSKSHDLAKTDHPLPGPVVRIEKRLKHLGKISKLADLDNPFLAFSMVSVPPVPPPGEENPKNKYVWALFLDSVALRTLGPALKLLPPGKMNLYRKHFKAHQQSWWDAKQVWAQWPDSLTKMRLVAYENWPD